VYRAAIRTGDRAVEIAAKGLGETGDAGDVPALAGLLNHRLVPVRRAAIRALRILSAENQEEKLLRVVESDAPSIVREAALAFLAARAVPAQAVWEAVKWNGAPRAKQVVLGLMWNAGKRVQLRVFLEAAASGESELAERAAMRVDRRWFDYNRSLVQPSQEEVQTAWVLLKEVHRVLRHRTVRELESILKSYINVEAQSSSARMKI
jgi:hypothetical protein